MSGVDSLGTGWFHGNRDRDNDEGNSLRGGRTRSALVIVSMRYPWVHLTHGKLVIGVWSEGEGLDGETSILEVV